LDIPEEKITILPLGLDNNKFSVDEKSGKDIRDRLSISSKYLIIFAGNFDPRKDIDVLLKAFSQIESKFDVELLMLGNVSQNGGEKYMEQLRRSVISKEIENSVTFHKKVDHSELPSYLNAADIGVWPGKLGITTIEAVGTGLPVIVCKSDATRYIIENNNGLEFERGSEDELANQLCKYLSDDRLRSVHKTNAVQHAETELSWEAIAEKNFNVYKRFI
jgi:glycosyltransferase involved in cell wall biosynthesis